MRSLLILIVAILLLTLAGATLALALGIGIGWILTQLLPFSLFEGSMLGLVAVIFIGYRVARFLMTSPDFVTEDFETPLWDKKDGLDLIPQERFIPAKGRPTWAHWYQYIFANEICENLEQDAANLTHMSESQRTELSVRLAELIVDVLQTKPPSTRRLYVTKKQLLRAFAETGQRPYNDAIMDTALAAAAAVLKLYGQGITEIINERMWKKHTPMFDVE